MVSTCILFRGGSVLQGEQHNLSLHKYRIINPIFRCSRQLTTQYSIYLLVFTNYNVLPERGYEKALNESLRISNVFPYAT